MIVKMKKAAILCLSSDKEKALDKLRAMGVLHIEKSVLAESPDRGAVENQIAQASAAAAALESVRRRPHTQAAGHPKSPGEPGEAVAVITRALATIADHEKQLESLSRAADLLAPWGGFNRASVEKIAEAGIHIYFCSSSRKTYSGIAAAFTTKIVNEQAGSVCFLVISDSELDTKSLPLAQLPENTDMHEISRQMRECQACIASARGIIESYAGHLPAIRRHAKELAAQAEFLSARDSMLRQGEIVSLSGFIPEDQVEPLRTASLSEGWAVAFRDPLPDEKAPTLIRTRGIVRLAKPIFDFIGMTPGYDEWDVSACFLLFFSIYFAMIIGDAGYGILFLSAVLFAKARFRDQKFRTPLNLMMTLSVMTIIWGVLNGNFLGISASRLPECMRGLDSLTNPETKNRNIQLICFTLAAAHLSAARLWKAAILANLKSLGQIGWLLFIWANYFTILSIVVLGSPLKPFVIWLYAAGIVLLMAFNLDWKDPGDIFNFPFRVIGSFTDVLSFIRLFAVGLASFYLADSCNTMAAAISCKIPYGLGFLCAAILLVVGHSLNIALSLMGVLVHGIRLNTLEFSNHMELQWRGIPYRPFKRDDVAGSEAA